MADTAHVTVTGGDYEHTREIDGFSTHGVRVAYRTLPVRQIFDGMREERRFDACEFSLANYILMRGTGHDWLQALPVFPSRAFRHGLAMTRKDSALTKLGDLQGARIGVDDYSMTAAVWFRALLAEQHGVDLDSITWVTGAKQRFAIPAGARVEKTTADLEDLLTDGSIDVLLGFNLRDSALAADERRLRPVLADVEAEERAYYERTGIYPIMHVVVVRNDVLDKNGDIAPAIAAAYESSKARAIERRLPATMRAVERFGGDPLPYGLAPVNRMVVEKLAKALHQQGFIAKIPDVDSLFVAFPAPGG